MHPDLRLKLTLIVPSFLSSQKNDRGEKQDTLLPIIPSWNDVLSMEHWGRDKRKREIANAILSALRASGTDSSTKTTTAKSMQSIAADTLVSYLETVRVKRKLRSAKRRLAQGNQSTPS
jgi:hypothetical protein